MTAVTAYTDAKQVVRVTGIGVTVEGETVGTGDSSEDSFDLDNGNVIADTYTLFYGASGSNDTTDLTETTHYTIDKDAGTILLTTAGVTALGTNILYASYTYSPKLSNTVIESFLDASEDEVEKATGNYWGTTKSTTEYFSGRKDEYPTGDQPYADDYEEPDFVVLKYKGDSISSITSVKFLTRGGATTTEEELNSYDTDLDTESAQLTLLNNRIPNGTRNVEVIYEHGYDSVPPQISELTAYYVGLRVYAYITGGSYDDATGFTLGRKQVSIGEVYVNVREVVRQFEVRIQSILDSVGRKMDVM